MSKILVSACLAGFPCRYDGSSRENLEVAQLIEEGKAMPICPEQLSGLPTPRPAVELSEGRALASNGEDFTEEFQEGAKKTLALAKKYHCTKAILKSDSPSCGFGCIYDGSFSGERRQGNGFTAELLSKNGLEIESR